MLYMLHVFPMYHVCVPFVLFSQLMFFFFTGTWLMVEYIEKFWIPTISAYDILNPRPSM